LKIQPSKARTGSAADAKHRILEFARILFVKRSSLL